MQGGCIAANILEYARGLERELNNTTPPAPSLVWPEILRLQEKIAELQRELVRKSDELECVHKRLKNQLRSEETISRLRESLESLTTISMAIESEAWKLRSQLARAVEIAEMYQRGNSGLHYQCNCAMCQLLGDLKGELK